jgi:hypothetical protein
VITPEDLDIPVPGANECMLCGAEIWSCICNPKTPWKRPCAQAQIEASRSERLTRSERDRGAA